MSKKVSREDEVYKYIIKKLGIRFHRYLGYGGNSLVLKNVELTPMASDNKFMDIFYEVDEKSNFNIELQSSPVYESKMMDMYKYRIYSESEDEKSFNTCVFATYNPNYGIEELSIDEDVDFHPNFHYTKKQNAREFLSTIKFKVENKCALSDDEAIDLIIAPDMEHDFEIKLLLEFTSELLVNAVILDENFHLDFIDCQKKMLQRFLEVADRNEVEKMLNLKAEDYGFEPNVTGFEESVNLAFLDGKREGVNNAKLEDASNLLDLGVDEEIISKATGLDLDTIRKLK